MSLNIIIKERSSKAISSTTNLRLNRYSLIFEIDPPMPAVRLEQITTVFGRDVSCDVVVEERSLSRRHCLIEVMARGLKIRDLDSTNGTLVNGILIKEAFLEANDVVKLGTFAFTIRVNEESASTPKEVMRAFPKSSVVKPLSAIRIFTQKTDKLNK